jgi:hypothetical protein
VPDGGLVPRYECGRCGALSIDADSCPDWGTAALPVPDVIEERATRTVEDSGEISVTRDAPSRIAARLQFPATAPRDHRLGAFRGSHGTVYAHLAPLRGMPAPPAGPAPPKVRHITSWIRRRPDNLGTDEQLQLTDVLAACPHLDALHHHVKAFAEMMTGRHGERLDAWIAATRADDLPHLHTFTNGLERDHAAVLNGLTLPYGSGAAEGRSSAACCSAGTSLSTRRPRSSSPPPSRPPRRGRRVPAADCEPLF